jgi:aspartyl-tRNA(Asn)/glutamyl-tRNA(Gln) amidotransferase subunit C
MLYVIMTIDSEEIEKLTELCRIACTDEEKERLRWDLNMIANYIALLAEIDTAGVEPCNRVLETVKNVMREDEPGKTLDRELFLANAQEHVAGLIRVPPVLKGE